MSSAEAVKSCFSNYATFTGRARRSEFWFFYLFVVLCMVALAVFMGVTAAWAYDPATGTVAGAAWVVNVVAVLAATALVIPMIAAAVRRLHDTGRSGFWYFIAFVPFVGGIILLVFLAEQGQPSANQFGPDPRLSGTQPSVTV